MIQYTILLFGPAAAAVGQDRVVVETQDACNGQELKSMACAQFPAIDGFITVGRLAVNQGFAADDALIEPDAEIALISMVSGG